MTQKERIIEYLRNNKKASNKELCTNLHMTNSTPRISELRRDGYKIEAERVKGKDFYGNKTDWLEYTLIED